ncbi:MAG: 2Fe-2S iron-sulfur cluster-binding protein [Pseudomonadota bacterium]
MPTLRLSGQSFSVRDGESVLETLLSANCVVPNSCRAGVCQSCLMQLVKGQLNEGAQRGLKDSWQAQGLFLACQCHPEQDLEIKLPAMDSLRMKCRVSKHSRLNAEVAVMRLQPKERLEYRPGQHVTIWKDELLGRSYSLASVPAIDDDELEFHIRRQPHGILSPWLYEDIQVGDQLQVQGPGGECFYTASGSEQNLLLAGTGTGLAPLYGILRDALQQGHAGAIHLYHGAMHADGLYLHETLQQLAQIHQNLHYHPCVLNHEPGLDTLIRVENLADALRRDWSSLQGWRVYLCGDEPFVNQQRKQCYLAGARLQEIYADAFIRA